MRAKPPLRILFWAYHRDNPKIYEAFCRFANEMIVARRVRLSSSLLFERIRWYTTVEAYDEFDRFKINNNYKPFYARLWMRDHPNSVGGFQLRQQAESDWEEGE